MRHLNNERECIKSCLHNHFNPARENLKKIEAIAGSGMDWNRLYNLAAANRVVVPVWDTLQQVDISKTVDAGVDRFKEAYNDCLSLNFLLTGEVLKLAGIFKANNIPFIIYKGITIAQLYPKPFFRQSNDIDILVKEIDLGFIKCIFNGLGYLPILPEDEGRSYRPLSDDAYKDHIENFHNYACSFYNGQMEIEIHWKLACATEPIQFPMELLWKRCVFKKYLDVDLPVLGDEDFLLSLFFHHGLKSQGLHNGNWRQLRFVVDIAMVLKKFQFLNWEELMLAAKDLGLKKSLLVGTCLANQILGVELPRQIHQEVEKNKASMRIATGINRVLFEKRGPFDDLIFNIDQTINVREGLTFKIKRILKPNGDDKRWVRLPTWLNFFYYLVRPFRLLGKYGKAYFSQVVRG